MASEKKVSMPGVAEGKKLIGVPTDDDIPPMARVNALFFGSMPKDDYQVSNICKPVYSYTREQINHSHITLLVSSACAENYLRQSALY